MVGQIKFDVISLIFSVQIVELDLAKARLSQTWNLPIVGNFFHSIQQLSTVPLFSIYIHHRLL